MIGSIFPLHTSRKKLSHKHSHLEQGRTSSPESRIRLQSRSPLLFPNLLSLDLQGTDLIGIYFVPGKRPQTLGYPRSDLTSLAAVIRPSSVQDVVGR